MLERPSGVITAHDAGQLMLTRPDLDTTGKTYSNFTLGRMGGGVLSNLAKRELVRRRKFQGVTFAIVTKEGREWCGAGVDKQASDSDEDMPADLQHFLRDHL